MLDVSPALIPSFVIFCQKSIALHIFISNSDTILAEYCSFFSLKRDLYERSSEKKQCLSYLLYDPVYFRKKVYVHLAS